VSSSDPGQGPLPIGAAAPDFKLRHTFEESVGLQDLLAKGPVVVAFYVFDFGNI
jgi:peroxiredoxin